MFFRVATDGIRTSVDLRNLYAGPAATACWIIGGGPSLAHAPCDEIQRSPMAKFAVNLCGTQLVQPNLWTAYDPTTRFHRSTYLDASILKLLPSRRAMDLAPDSTFKVCECPNVVFFDRDMQRGFHDFPPLWDPTVSGVVDWQDSLIQAIELAWWLGFRRLYLVGAEMCVRPEQEHITLAGTRDVEYREHELLKSFVQRCHAVGITSQQLERAGSSRPYHFDETKSLKAAIQTDWHYFRVVQYLRLSRRSMAMAGLELISATPDSRLNAFFPYRPAEDVLAEQLAQIGDPLKETTRGRYSRKSAGEDSHLPLMRDFKPHHWAGPNRPASQRPASLTTAAEKDDIAQEDRFERAHQAVAELQEVPVFLDECG